MRCYHETRKRKLTNRDFLDSLECEWESHRQGMKRPPASERPSCHTSAHAAGTTDAVSAALSAPRTAAPTLPDDPEHTSTCHMTISDRAFPVAGCSSGLELSTASRESSLLHQSSRSGGNLKFSCSHTMKQSTNTSELRCTVVPQQQGDSAT